MEKKVIDEELYDGLKNFQAILNKKLGNLQIDDTTQQSLSSDEDSQKKETIPPIHPCSPFEKLTPLERQLSSFQVCNQWSDKMEEVLFTAEQIRRRVAELGAQISNDYKGKKIFAVGLLTGAFVFMADLLRYVNVPYIVDFMVVSSYGSSTESTGNIRLKKDLSIDCAGKDVLIIEDIIDTGLTLWWIKRFLSARKTNSIKIAALLDKKSRRDKEVKTDYIGFDCPNSFVVGYGLDYDDEYRCVPFIAALKPSAYQKSLVSPENKGIL